MTTNSYQDVIVLTYTQYLSLEIVTLFVYTAYTFLIIIFSQARLRLDKQTSESTRKALIIEILTELGLMKVANSRIGTSKFGNQKVCEITEFMDQVLNTSLKINVRRYGKNIK